MEKRNSARREMIGGMDPVRVTRPIHQYIKFVSVCVCVCGWMDGWMDGWIECTIPTQRTRERERERKKERKKERDEGIRLTFGILTLHCVLTHTHIWDYIPLQCM